MCLIKLRFIFLLSEQSSCPLPLHHFQRCLSVTYHRNFVLYQNSSRTISESNLSNYKLEIRCITPEHSLGVLSLIPVRFLTPALRPAAVWFRGQSTRLSPRIWQPGVRQHLAALPLALCQPGTPDLNGIHPSRLQLQGRSGRLRWSRQCSEEAELGRNGLSGIFVLNKAQIISAFNMKTSVVR